MVKYEECRGRSPHELLKCIYDEIGEDGFRDSKRLNAFIADLFDDTTGIKKRITYAVSSDLHLYILNEPEGRLEPYRLQYIIKIVEDHTGLSHINAEEIMRMFAYATGRIEIYEKEKKYYDSLHPVRVNGKYGYADSNNDVVISPKYDKAKPFVGDRAKVCIDGLYGFIDRSGYEVINLIYEYAEDFNREITEVILNGIKHVIDKNGIIKK